jgi:hypothetical protein
MFFRSSMALLTLAALALAVVAARSARDASAGQSLTDPPFPVQMSARVIKRTPPSKLLGDRLLFTYCFAEPMPHGRRVRPSRLWLGVDNPNDHLPPFVLQWPITKACGDVDSPTARTKRPFFVVVSVAAPSGNMTDSVARLKPVFK